MGSGSTFAMIAQRGCGRIQFEPREPGTGTNHLPIHEPTIPRPIDSMTPDGETLHVENYPLPILAEVSLKKQEVEL